MANALILHSDVLSRSSTVVSATNAVASMPASKLSDPDVLDKFRSSTGSTVISIDAGSSVPVRGLFMAGLGPDTMTTLGTLQVRASAVSQTGTDIVNWSKTDVGARFDIDRLFCQAWIDLGQEYSARWWQVTVTATGSSTLDIGRLLMGPDLGISFNLAYPFTDGQLDLSRFERMMSGRPAVLARRKLRRYSIQYGDGLSESDHFDKLQRILSLSHSRVGQVAMIVDPAGTSSLKRQSVLGRIESGDGAWGDFRLYGRRFEIIEDGGIDPTRVLPYDSVSVTYGDDSS